MKKTILLFTLFYTTIFLSQEITLPGASSSLALQNAISAINNRGTIIVSGNLNITYTMEIPEGITLRFINGSKIIIYKNVMLTYNGGIDAGFYQIFDVDATAFLTGEPNIKYAVPQWWQLESNNLDWSKSIESATKFYPRVYLKKGDYNVIESISLSPTSSHYLYGESINSKIRNISNSNYIFKMKNTTNQEYSQGLTITNLYFESVNGLQFNDDLTQHTDSINDYILKIEVANCIFKGLNTDGDFGTAIYMSKVFDSEIKFNQIQGFNIGVNLRGCDINSINNNRINNFKKFGILDESFGTFGSQNEINHNDILSYQGIDNKGAFIKSFSRHVTIKNNYLENTAHTNVVGTMIDCSNYSSDADYIITPSDKKSYPYYISISENRLDVTDETANYTYLIQDDFATLFIDDQSNINSYPPSKFINSDGDIFSDFLRSRFNDYREKTINIQSATSFNEWNGFKTQIQFDKAVNNSFIIDSKHTPSAITKNSTPTDTYFNPHYIILKDDVPSYKVNLTQRLNINGEKELPKNIIIRMTFRVKSVTGTPTLYMRADDSNNSQGSYYYNSNLGSNDDYKSISFSTNKDYVKYLYIVNRNCDIEVKSIEILPDTN